MNFKNKVFEAIYSRRSVRNFLDKKVPKKVVEELLKAGVMAPSAKNTQPWNFSVVTNMSVINELGDLAIKKRNSLVKTGVKLSIKSIFYNAPLLIVISG